MRQSHREVRAGVLPAGHGDGAAVPVHDALCDGEAEAITAGSPGPGVIGAVKPFKQVGQMLRRDSRSGIVDRQADTAPLRA